ncbi:MBL fold metallo-hydrolase [Burkholderiaceae bacterium DAT-1]|nr:MBL fold metallo-hydrolase [Burkholderiaceae bacterium DAT-1]
MNRITLRNFTLAALASLSVTVNAADSALAPQPARPDFSKVEIKTTKLSDSFYTLEGQGGTISVLTGKDGVLLVDSQYGQLTDKLVAAIRKLSDKPIKYLINTHVHGDHVGGNENFGKLGVTILSRDQLRSRLQHPAQAPDGTTPPAAAEAALPAITYDGPVTLHFDHEAVRLIPLRNAHTDGDTLVSFANHDILAAGDDFRSVGYPFVDLNNGGSLNGILDGLATIIGRAGPNTRIIPGHGPITDRKGIVAQRDIILAVRDRITELVRQGKSLDEVIAARPTADFDNTVQDGAKSSERFIKWVYTEVKKTV